MMWRLGYTWRLARWTTERCLHSWGQGPGAWDGRRQRQWGLVAVVGPSHGTAALHLETVPSRRRRRWSQRRNEKWHREVYTNWQRNAHSSCSLSLLIRLLIQLPYWWRSLMNNLQYRLPWIFKKVEWLYRYSDCYMRRSGNDPNTWLQTSPVNILAHSYQGVPDLILRTHIRSNDPSFLASMHFLLIKTYVSFGIIYFGWVYRKQLTYY